MKEDKSNKTLRSISKYHLQKPRSVPILDVIYSPLVIPYYEIVESNSGIGLPSRESISLSGDADGSNFIGGDLKRKVINTTFEDIFGAVIKSIRISSTRMGYSATAWSVTVPTTNLVILAWFYLLTPASITAWRKQV